MTTVRLFTGSRAMADGDTPELLCPPLRWAKEAATAHLAGVDLVIVGDARGVDRMVHSVAVELGLRVRRFQLDGTIRDTHESAERWAPAGAVRPIPGSLESKRWPLERNMAMVREAQTRRDAGDDVTGVALYAPWSPRGGTGQTADAMLRAHIFVTWMVCPVPPPLEFGAAAPTLNPQLGLFPLQGEPLRARRRR